MIAKRNVRVGNVSGAVGDHPHAMQRMAAHGSVDVITGDWLSEMNIAWNAITKQENPDLGYEAGFLDQLEESLDVIVQKGIKVVSNAGALNPQALAARTQELCRKHGYSDVMVATVVGDDISELVQDREQLHELGLAHLDHDDWKLSAWEQQPVCGNAYIGSWGINKALGAGAQIVICGRVTDASPVIGAASWWHGWTEHDFDQLAGALVAGHLIECGPYVCGANFSGFKSLMPLVDVAFPIAEIGGDGTCAISKLDGLCGAVTKFTVTAQLLYELQGELYLNSDVVANLSGIRLEEPGTDRVHVFGVRGLPPPPTTKAMIAAPGGYQAETTFYINGLDVAAKAQMMKDQIKHAFRDSKFSKFSVELYGSPASNPSSQQEGTVMLRVFAQAEKLEDISKHKFLTPIYALRMQSYPGYHMSLDFRTMQPKPFMKIFPVTISQASLSHAVHLPKPHGTIGIPPPSRTAHYPAQRPSYETADPVDMASFGPSRTAALGSIVHARSGDKADNANVGFFVRNADEYPWLQSLLTVDKLKQLLGKDWEGREGVSRIERCEFPKLFAVHFRILDFLDGGIASSARIDGLGKGIGEYLRSREVDIPMNFLDRGCI